MRALVLVPVYSAVVPAVDRALRALESAGILVCRSEPGQSDLPRARSQMLEFALSTDAERILWVDSDIEFRPADAIEILKSPEEFMAGAYAAKTESRICLDPGGRPQPVSESGIGEVDYVGFGFVSLARGLVERVAAAVPWVEEQTSRGVARWRPTFCPLVLESTAAGARRYLSEDYAFCHRAREVGARIWVNYRYPLFHWGLRSGTSANGLTDEMVNP